MKKVVLGVLSAIGGAAAGVTAAGKVMGDRVIEKKKMSDKHLALFQMMNQWVKVKQAGKNLSSYLEKEGYKEIAIYGMSYAGETLVEELAGSNITVKYGIDQKADKIYADFDVVKPDCPLEEVDAVVVTSVTFFYEIEKVLCTKLNCPIISLEDILYQV